MPLPFVGGVVARLTQQIAKSVDLGRHAADPGEIGIVEHACLLDMLPGVEHRARWRAYTGVDAMVHEHSAALHQLLMGRQPVSLRQLSGSKEALLVGEYEQDVV